MIWTAVGIVIGIILGLNMPFAIPIEYIKYTAVLILGILDSILGAIKAETTKDEEYNQVIFLSGLIFNTLFALLITLLGEKLGLDLYLAVTVVFVFRIFKNLGAIRREIVKFFQH